MLLNQGKVTKDLKLNQVTTISRKPECWLHAPEAREGNPRFGSKPS